MRSTALACHLWTSSKRLSGRMACFGQALLGSLFLLPAVAWGSAGTAYRALSINGELAPPPYGLRLDGFYDGSASSNVTFHLIDVYFDQYNDGTALLRGEIAEAEHTSSEPRLLSKPGATNDESVRYLLNVNFVQITDPAQLALIENYRADWTYYDIDPSGVEIQRVNGASDSANLWLYPDDHSQPFRVGNGANGINQNFGAAGLLSFEHYRDGKVYGGGPGVYLNTSEFRMDLQNYEAQPCDSVKTVDNFTLEFMGVEYDFDAGTSHWEYELTWDGSPPALSHIFIELCKDLTDGDLLAVIPGNGSIGPDGSTGLYGIKWDPPPRLVAGVPVRLSFTLDRLLDVESVGFFPKASINYNYAQICGPSLECREPAGPCEVNLPPVVQPPPVPDPIRCVPVDGRVCIPGWIVTDPDGDAITYGTMGSGTFDPATGTFCKIVGAPGQYTMTLSATDICGATTTASLTFEVLGNNPPTVELSASPVALCLADTVCVEFTASDDHDSSLTITTNLGHIEGSRVCFAADTSGVYRVILKATDDCGLQGADTAFVAVTLNQRPEISGPLSDSAGACGPTQVCVGPYLFTDFDGDELTVTVTGGAVIDGSGMLCFTADTTGRYEFLITVSDSCGSTSQTVVVVVTPNEPPVWTHVPDTSVTLCEPGDSVCITLEATDPNGDPICYTVMDLDEPPLPAPTCVPALYCFVPTESRTYRLLVSAKTDCSVAVLDTAYVTVEFNTPPEIEFSLPDTTIFVCNPDTLICFNVNATDPDGDPVILREILNPGYYNGETGEVCFNPDSICFGHSMTTDTTICLVFGATDECGPEVTDSLCIRVIRNREPVVRAPQSQSVTLCAPGQVCVPGFVVSDPDGDALQITVPSGGTYENGTVCFQVSEPGSYQVIVCATDACGISVCDTMQVEVDLNGAPVVLFGPDTTVALCEPGTVCVPLPAIGDPDGDIPLIQIQGADQSGDQLCFPATSAGTHLIVVRAVDSCGASDEDTLQVTVRINSAPRVWIKNGHDLTLCDLDTTLCYGVKVSDMDGSPLASLQLIKTDTSFWSLDGQTLCLDVALAMADRTEGTFQAIVKATDICGAKGLDTISIHLKANQPPFVSLPADTFVTLCEPGEVCLGPLVYGDSVGTTPDLEVTGGTLLGDQICVTAEHDSLFVIVATVRDSCGATDTDTLRVNVHINRPPLVVLPEVDSIAVCALDTICVDGIEGQDPESGRLPAELISGPGQFDPATGVLCFVPPQNGLYEFTFSVTDGCETVTDTWAVEVISNGRPVFVTVPETTLFSCEPLDSVCLEFAAVDPDGDPVSYQILSGPGSIDASGRLCFVPDTSGTYSFTVTASDSCGASEAAIGTATVRINRAPSLQFSSSDTSLFLCDPDTLLCFTVTGFDPDGPAPEIVEILNPGEFNPLTGVFCFNPAEVCFDLHPTHDTTICVIFEAVDSCGARSVDSFCVHVTRNLEPIVDLGPDHTASLCEAGPVCVDLTSAVSDPDGDLPEIHVEAPAYLNGSQACINVTEPGRVSIVVCATDSCGLSSCDTVFIDVTINSAPVVILPADTSVGVCAQDEACVGPVTIYDPDLSDSLEITVSGPGFIQGNGYLCFGPGVSGDQLFIVTATDRCGISDVDSILVNVQINQPPDIIFSVPDTTLSLCNTDTLLCFGVTVVDPDGEGGGFEDIPVPGTFDAATGLWCFNPDSLGSGPLDHDTTICAIFSVYDNCLNSVTDTLCIELKVNRPPVIEFSPHDTIVYVCQPDTLLCYGITATDPDGDSVEIREVVNPGEYYPELGEFCFSPTNVCYPNTPCAAGPTCVIFEAVDACGNVTRDSICVEVFANVPPVVVTPEADTVTAIQCLPGDEVCISPVFGMDFEDGQLPVFAPGARYDSLLNALCFDADSTGLYKVVATTQDSCNQVATVEIWVDVVSNIPPTLALQMNDTTVQLCGPDSVCVPVLITDPEDDWVVSEIIGPAHFNPATRMLCVFVGTSEPITVGLEITDQCGVSASDQVTITPTVGQPPTVELPADFTAQVCLPGPYCFGPISIVGDIAGPPQVSGGTYDEQTGNLCIDVTASGAYTVIVSVSDSCGASASDTVVVNVILNRPPVTSFSSSDTSLYLCTADTVLCFNFSATDPDGDLVLLGEVLNPGIFDPLTGDFCFNPSDICFGGPNNKCPAKRYSYDTTICLIFSATDTCGAEVLDTLCVHVTANEPPVVVAPNDTTIIACGPGPFCLNPFLVSDANDDFDSLTVISSGPAHTFNPATGILCFTADPGTYVFRVTATDLCGATSTDSVQVTVVPNQPPVVTLPADFTTANCQSGEICVAVSASDPDPGDVPVITAVLPNTTYHPEDSTICFTPDTSGVYLVIARATDRCGLADLDTVRVTVTVNRPPVWVQVPAIDTFFCSPPGSLCFSVNASDPDVQPLIYKKLSGPGNIDSLTGQICFNPGSSTALFTFIVTATDPCGAVARDTATVNVRINRAPVLNAMRDTLVDLCQAGPVCFPPVSATDPDGNTITYTLLSGSGTLTGTVYCFNADTSGFYAIRVKATDPCGLADTVLFHASVRVNHPPTLQLPAPAPIILCAPMEVCQSGITASDVDGGPVTIVKTSGPGTFDAALGRLCFTPASAGTYNFDFRATDTCGAQTNGRLTITVIINRAPTLDVPSQVSACPDSQVCIAVGGIDPDQGNRLTITQVSGPAGTFVPNPLTGPTPLSGQWCWQPSAAGTYFAVFRVTDSCGLAAVDTTRIDVSEFCDSLCFAATIPNICPDSSHPDHWLFQGRTHEFPVMVTPSRAVGAFDFLIGFDASALTVQNVVRGSDISAWEFFTYRLLDPNEDCSGLCPSGLVRIVGIADINNGAPIQDPSQMQPADEPQEYARITFHVSNDRTLGGQFVSVDFWWNDCGDNTFSSPQGDLYVASSINPDTCVGAGAKEDILACASFEGGGGCIPTAADIDDRGDLNLNGIGYEIADAVLYSNYFIFGDRVFDPNPIKQASQVAASDVNADGSTLTVADLVFLIRIIVGLEEPIDPGGLRIPSRSQSVTLGWTQQDEGASLQLEGSVATGALALDIRTERSPESVELSAAAQNAGMELMWHAEGDRLKLLVYSMEAHALPPGAHEVLVIRGAGRLETIQSQASDESGGALTVALKAQVSLPVTFDLDPNFPNPFNPETEIRFTLNQPATVSLVIFNVLGQQVACLADRIELAAGEHRYRWLARDTHGIGLASGVYLYRLTAGGHSETRKMMLLR